MDTGIRILQRPPKELSNTLTKNDYKEIQSDDLNQKSAEEEFVPFFLDNLRNQLTKVIQDYSGPQQILPVKKIVDQSLNISNSKNDSIEHNISLNESTDSMLNGGKSFEFNNSNSFELDNSLELSSSFCKPHGDSIEEKNLPIIRKKVKLIQLSSNSPQYNRIDPAFSLQEESFPSLDRTNKNTSYSTPVKVLNKSSSFDVPQTSCTPKSKIMKTPDPTLRNIDCYSSNDNQQYFTSTPKNRINNLPKSNSKRSPIQLNLGDFIQISTKKSSTKKRRSKGKSISEEQANDSQQNTSNEHQILNSQHNTSIEQNIKRKVNPTRLSFTNTKKSEDNAIFKDVVKPFTQNPQFINVPTIDKSDEKEAFQDERSLLKEEKEKRPEKGGFEIKTQEDNLKSSVGFPAANKVIESASIITPDINLVKNIKVLNQLAEIYSNFLDENLVVNPMTEFHLIINLLATQYKTTSNKLETENHDINIQKQDTSNLCETELNKSNDSLITNLKQMNLEKLEKQLKSNVQIEKNIGKNQSYEEWNSLKTSITSCLVTPHDCVYFACKVLELQKNFLKSLNKTTLKLLFENKQIVTFQPDLSKFLNTVYQSKMNCNEEIKSVNFSEKSNVCFQKDEDNYENFSSNAAFQCFKKQRDIFYEILKKWEDHHLENGWKFQILKGEINRMLSVDLKSSDYMHLTRLFKTQMLNSCISIGHQEDILNDETNDFIKNLKDVDSEKMNLLKQKLVTPMSQNSPVPLPSFPGIQEFYKDFILHAANTSFYLNLENTFINDIMDLNNSQFTSSDIDETKTEVDIQTKQKFNICLSSLGILGKFLGFLISIPYKPLPIMKWSVPSIDLQYCLNTAVINGKLSLTIPWVVEYLSMLEHESLKIPYYKKILEVLYCIYRASACGIIIGNSKQIISQETVILIKLMIGWLFNLPKFPIDYYYSWQSKYKSLKLVNETLQCIVKFENRLAEIEMMNTSIKDCLFLDRLDLIDDRILYNCCPFLKEFNNVLIPKGSRFSNNTKSRHVTPVTYQLQKSTKKTNIKNLEMELEKSFFNGQPESTRKTVDYVSERISSSCRKHIYKIVLPSEGKKLFEELKDIICKKNLLVKNNFDNLKKSIFDDMILLSEKASTNFKDIIEKTIVNYCETCVTNSIESLLAQDCSPAVKNMCIKITVRMTMERVNQWVHSRIVGGLIFMKQMESELFKYCKNCDEEDAHKKYHNLNAPSPTEVLSKIRELLCDILNTRGKKLKEEDLLIFWDQMYQCLTERLDSKPTTEKTLLCYSIDLTLFVIAHKPEFLSTKFYQKIFKIWKLDSFKLDEIDSPFLRILCSRNLIILTQSNDQLQFPLQEYSTLLKQLMTQKIITISELNDQATFLISSVKLKREILNFLSQVLSDIIHDYNAVTDEEIKEVELIKNLIEVSF